ncbi:MAG: DUF1736 domain-containing protein, partial [Bacteroidetes bacterium]|nr:DUF1736 domain-containing protein [Bacteroidota bacterium]
MKKPPKTTPAPKVSKQSAKAKRKIKWVYPFIFLFVFVLYGNSIQNKYALDDMYAISGNKFTKQGIAGIPSLLGKDFFAGYYGDRPIFLPGGRYRPLSLVSFAIEYQLFGDNPQTNHFFNVLLYALCCCLLYYLLTKIIEEKIPPKWSLSLPLVATLLFIAHPVHTEVVANIKGRDEILSLSGALVTAILYLKYLDTKKPGFLVFIFISFFLAVMSKENAFLFLILIPLTVYFFRKFNAKDNLFALIPMLIAGFLFVLIRTSVLGGISSPPSTELLDNPFIQATTLQKYATILLTLGMYLKLLFIPHPLTWDYYPYHIPLVNFSDIRTLLSLVIYTGLLIVALSGLRKKYLLSYAIWFYLICIFLVSNIIFPIGTFLAERFLFQPSLAFCLFLSWFLLKKMSPFFNSLKNNKLRAAVPSILVVVLLLFSIKTISRNPVWKDDYTLYTTDVETSANSAKSNNIAGQWFAWAANQPENEAKRNELRNKALEHLRKAVRIHPAYQDALFQLGNVYYDFRQDVDSTLYCYEQILRLDSNEEHVYKNLGVIIGRLEYNNQKIRKWEEILALIRFQASRYIDGIIFTDSINVPAENIIAKEKIKV